MKIALVASPLSSGSTSLERHVLTLARGLTAQGVEVELVTQDTALRSPRVVEEDGLVARRFPATSRGLRFAAAPGLREQIRHAADSSDVIHIHASRGPLAAAAAGVASQRLVFTPCAPIQRLMRWPYAPMVRSIFERGTCIALSHAEAELIRGLLPHSADRVLAIPPGVELAAIEAARPLVYPGRLVLAGDSLEGDERVERAIAAMASLDDGFRLVVRGDRPAARRLQRYADDLRVGERVEFVGRTPAALVYRWLRTARVVVALRERDPSGVELLEALGAGAAVVASDVAVHREAASYTGGAGVEFVSPECSPLELADAIAAAAEVRVSPAARTTIPAGEAVAAKTLAVYGSLMGAGGGPRGASPNGSLRRFVPGA
jgi:glycosyltransferase involved in cell wall biosynthesis